MARHWESWLQAAAQPASSTEEAKRDRTEQRVREAIRASSEIPSSVKVYVKGSYKNNTNVREDADVDVCVEWTDFYYVSTWGKTAGKGPTELGYTPNHDPMTHAEFSARVERALVRHLGAGNVDTSGDKAIDVAAGSNTLKADVIPCFELRRWDEPTPTGYVIGQRLFPKSGGQSTTSRSRTTTTASPRTHAPAGGTSRSFGASRSSRLRCTRNAAFRGTTPAT
jgi:hypothetical protein